MLILVVSVQMRLLPPEGRDDLSSVILPAITLGAYQMARTMRLVRFGMLEAPGQDYIRTARAKGLPERLVILGHAIKNMLIPVVTVIGLDLGTLLGGAVITETIFAWPGIGGSAIQAISTRDYPVVEAVVFVIASGYVLINLGVDILYGYLNPRTATHDRGDRRGDRRGECVGPGVSRRPHLARRLPGTWAAWRGWP